MKPADVSADAAVALVELKAFERFCSYLESLFLTSPRCFIASGFATLGGVAISLVSRWKRSMITPLLRRFQADH